MPWKNTPPKGYVSTVDIKKACKRNGLEVSLGSIRLRIDNNKIPSIRDINDRRSRFVPVEEIPNIIAYYSKLHKSRGRDYYKLSKLATDLGLHRRYLHQMADKIGINTVKIGSITLIEKNEYFKWRILLSRKQEKEKKYVSTGDVGRYFGVSYQLIWYNIKRGRIPAEKLGYYYRISRKDFEENKEEWRKQCGFPDNGEKV